MSCDDQCQFTDAYLNNDGYLLVSDLVDREGTELTSATLTYEIYDADGTAVAGASGSLTQIGTSNEYSADIDKDIINLLTSGEEYYIRIIGSQDEVDFEFSVLIRATRRGRT